MRVCLSTFGSRGDTEPLAALGVALQAAGAEAVVCAPTDTEFVDLLERAGVPYAPAFYSVRKWIADKSRPAKPEDFAALMREMMAGQIRAIGEAAEGCDAIVATGLVPNTGAAQAVAEKHGLRYFHASLCPLYLPSHHHHPYPYPSHPHPRGETDNRVLWRRDVEAMNLMFRDALNEQRATLGLPGVENVREHVFTRSSLLASDPALWPWEETDLSEAVQTGAWVLRDTRPLPDGLEAFLGAGEAPVYVGFGSIAVPTAKAAALTVIAAARAKGRPVVLARGWADVALEDAGDDCFVVGDVNQQALFPRCAAVVHHGGAGTTHAAAMAGAPQLIVPQIVDQPYWAARVAALGVGAAHDGPAPSVESLSARLDVALAAETRVRARELAGRMRWDGAAVAAKVIAGG